MRSTRPTVPPGGKSSPAAAGAVAPARGRLAAGRDGSASSPNSLKSPPQLTPAAARTLLSILQKAVEKQKREAEADHQARRADPTRSKPITDV